jgi:hypothetical protein
MTTDEAAIPLADWRVPPVFLYHEADHFYLGIWKNIIGAVDNSRFLLSFGTI